MTNEQINIAIAEACGWKVISDTLCCIKPDINGDPEVEPIAPMPDYCEDLNAMHEAEKVLIDTGRMMEYGAVLYWIVVPQIARHDDHFIDWMIAGYLTSATARQRAEAFLRTLGEWEEETK